ncbi:MAG: Uma2 family endonuclease [Polyangiaceae bacterium]
MQSPIAQHKYLTYEVDRSRKDWTLPEETVPESRPHDLILDLLKALLSAWIARTGRNAQVGRNLAVRWDEEHPNIGTDPDIYVVEPPPPEGDKVESLRLWMPGHHPLRLAVEVVSSTNAVKDYEQAPDKHAAADTQELWVFDPGLHGPKSRGGPARLQIWSRSDDGAFRRIYRGDGPARSPVLGAWLFAVDEGERLRIADDQEGTIWWMTAEEAERAAKEQERAAKEQERAAKEAALARIAELEAALAKR